mmetsp:Transcript_7016/g.12472  ORF Transcript_7016/g.12472 Transcript_7016/m.12472 type:complete len:234 (-) Transcript_7016:888-1589(-)
MSAFNCPQALRPFLPCPLKGPPVLESIMPLQSSVSSRDDVSTALEAEDARVGFPTSADASDFSSSSEPGSPPATATPLSLPSGTALSGISLAVSVSTACLALSLSTNSDMSFRSARRRGRVPLSMTKSFSAWSPWRFVWKKCFQSSNLIEPVGGPLQVSSILKSRSGDTPDIAFTSKPAAARVVSHRDRVISPVAKKSKADKALAMDPKKSTSASAKLPAPMKLPSSSMTGAS